MVNREDEGDGEEVKKTKQGIGFGDAEKVFKCVWDLELKAVVGNFFGF